VSVVLQAAILTKPAPKRVNNLSAAMIADDENMRLYILDRLGRREAALIIHGDDLQ
jgi:hypothetical protein